MIVFELIEHDVWQSYASFERLGLFSSLGNAVDFLRSHVQEDGWDSSKVGFTVNQMELDDPGSETKVFCTTEIESDYDTIIWWDEHAKDILPSFYSVSGGDCDEGEFEDVVVSVGGDVDKLSNLIDVDMLFHIFEAKEDLIDCYQPGEFTFVFAGQPKKLSVDDVLSRGVIQ